MMDLPIPVKDNITSFTKNENAYFFETERGALKVSFVKDKLAHICFSPSKTFGAKQMWILDEVDDIPSDISEDKRNYYVTKGDMNIVISKDRSTIAFTKKDVLNDRLLFAEDIAFDREFEKVQEYMTIDDGQIETTDVVTADGVKKVVESAHKKEGRLLYKSRLHMCFEDDEALYGLGQSEEGVFNLRGHVRYLNQANRKIAIPVLMSSKGYGLFFPSGSAGMFCDNESGTYFQTEASETLEYYFLGGDNLDESISLLRYLTGKAELLPRWAYGYLQSKERYESEEEVLRITDEFRTRDIGMDAIILDWITWEDNMWGQKTLDPKRFPSPDAMMKKLHESDTHLMISIWPNMTEACDNHKEFKEAKLLLPGANIYDALDEEGRKLYWKQVYDGLYCHGIDGFWCDSSEPFTPEWIREIKPDAADMYKEYIKAATDCMPYDQINAYGFYHALGIYEGQRNISEHRVINLTRNGYPGSQRLGTILWSGDIGASFDTLRKQVAEGLNMCASGIPYWTLDIGAFFVKKGLPWYWEGKYPEGLSDLGYKELYVRWYQYGAFLPIFRSHGTDCPREPWQFGEPGDMFYDALIMANKLRYKLMPYIYSVAYRVWKDDHTMMRLLTFDFAEDENVRNIFDQYMFGPSLMVCPVLEEMYYSVNSVEIDKPKTRKIYFPKGCMWIDIRDKKEYKGGTWCEVPADIYSIPVFAKSGSIIPMCEGLKSTANLENAIITPVVYGDADCSFELYSDSGDGYEYVDGKGKLEILQYSKATGKITRTIK